MICQFDCHICVFKYYLHLDTTRHSHSDPRSGSINFGYPHSKYRYSHHLTVQYIARPPPANRTSGYYRNRQPKTSQTASDRSLCPNPNCRSFLSSTSSILLIHHRQKLKVTELKALLHKHDLPQTGKKEDLVQRALENNLSPEEEEEELVSLPQDDCCSRS
jgi:hypothetical protein